MVAGQGKHLGDNVLLANVVLGNVFELTPAARANSAARSRTRSRSGSANRAWSKILTCRAERNAVIPSA
jgi:hypothetical protein